MVAGGAAAAALVTAVALGAVAWSWGESLRDEQRLLPGATIAGAELGEETASAALERVLEVIDPNLDRVVEVTHGDQVWPVTARDLAGTTDAEDVVAAALERTTTASLVELTRVRWLGAVADLNLDVSVSVPEDEADRFVAGIAEQLDADPVDAAIGWDGDTVRLTESTDGLQVDRAAAVAAVYAAVAGSATAVELPVEVIVPTVTTALAEQALPDIVAAVDASLDRVVTLAHGDTTWEVTARGLGAEPDVAAVAAFPAASPVVSPASAGKGASTPGGAGGTSRVPLSFPDDSVTGFVEEIAAAIDVAPVNAQVSWVGRVEVTPERGGIALDRDGTADQLLDALEGAADRIDLRVVDVQPSVTSQSFKQVLVVRQNERILELHVDGKVTRSWPVAVGQGGSETPTGVFTVGTKRFEPTWYNPSPNGWGSDMPAVIRPGPSNPLGLRALNWNRNGADTLIRFHGTPNEASIGQAASKGCVRMFNRDVIELYDLIPPGTAILSVRG